MADFLADVVPEAAAVSALTERAAAYLADAGVDNRVAHHVALILDELLTNVATHGASLAPVSVRLSVLTDRVTGEVIDRGGCFDPRQAPVPDLSAGIDERPIGGLGLLLIRRVTDGFDHERIDDRNRTTFWIRRTPSD
jgi:serine/threonine-protein kinase RsbW